MATGSSASDIPEISDAPQDNTYPEQRHAGKVGYGPNYNMSASILEKVSGLIEESRGRILHNQNLIKLGHEKFTGQAKRRKVLGLDSNELNAFASATSEPRTSSVVSPKTDRSQLEQPPTDPGDVTGNAHITSVGAEEQAATVAPEGTDNANVQRSGEAVNHIKPIDERM